MNQDRKKTLVALAKKALAKWPGVKWTTRVKRPGTLIFTVVESNLDFAADVIESAPYGERAVRHIREDGCIDVNHYNLDRAWRGESLAFFTAARDALMTGNHNNSDPMTDYFDVGWYLSFEIGRWNKPCRFTFERAPESAERETPAGDDASEPGDELMDLTNASTIGTATPDELVARARDVSREMFGDDESAAAARGFALVEQLDALPNDDVFAAMLGALVNPESDPSIRDEVAERLERVGRSIEIRSFADAGVLTDNAGFVVSFGGLAEFQVTVVRSR